MGITSAASSTADIRWVVRHSRSLACLGEPSSYGMPMAESTNPTLNPNKYTGKELITNQAG